MIDKKFLPTNKNINHCPYCGSNVIGRIDKDPITKLELWLCFDCHHRYEIKQLDRVVTVKK